MCLMCHVFYKRTVHRCVWGGDSCYPLSCHSVSPKRLLWRIMLINLAEITSSRLSAILIVRMTSSPSPLSHLYPRRGTQSSGEKSLTQRDPVSRGGSVGFHLSCLFSLTQPHIHAHSQASALYRDFALA